REGSTLLTIECQQFEAARLRGDLGGRFFLFSLHDQEGGSLRVEVEPLLDLEDKRDEVIKSAAAYMILSYRGAPLLLMHKIQPHQCNVLDFVPSRRKRLEYFFCSLSFPAVHM